MKLINLITVVDAMISACNVPETDYAAWSAVTAYVVGNKCLFNHKNYECLINNTNAEPDQNLVAPNAKWLDLGYDNRWKMFDSKVGTQTVQADSITLTLLPGQMLDSIAFLDLLAATVEITITIPVVGQVYHELINLSSKSHIVDAYTYFFEPIILDDTVVLSGIPPYSTGTIAIIISNPGATAKIGTLVIGTQKELGGTRLNPRIGITDYSKKTVDSYGNYTVLQRDFAKRMNCELMLENSTTDDIYRTLARYRTTPVIWIGADDFSCMVVYGFFKNFEIAIPYPNNSLCTIEVEGLA